MKESKKQKVERIAVSLGQAVMFKDGSLDADDVMKCFETAERFMNYEQYFKDRDAHIKEVREAEKKRVCGCGNVLKDGERIYDNGWQYGYECSRCR